MKAEAAFNAGRDDGYRVVSHFESQGGEGSFGCRIAVMLPEAMYVVFDYDKMVGDARDPKNGDFTKTGMAPKYFVHAPSEEFINQIKMAYAHVDPAVEKVRQETKHEFYQMFVKAGFTPIYLQEIENEYWKDHWGYRYPWFIVTTTIGPIKIGHRKRVINIDWADNPLLSTVKAERLTKDDVTKGDKYIHAWSDEKAVDYLKELAKLVVPEIPFERIDQ